MADVNKKSKKSNICHVHKGGMPFDGCSFTNDRKAIKEMLRDGCLSELKII